MTELTPMKFFIDILRGRIKLGEKIVPVIANVEEIVELPFVTFHLSHTRELPYHITSLEVEGLEASRKVLRLAEYTMNVIIYATSVLERDSIISQVVELVNRARIAHFMFCKNLDGQICKTSNERCDAIQLYSEDSSYARCPYWGVDEESPNYRGPTSPFTEYGIFSVGVGRWDYDIEPDHKPPVHIATQEVNLIVEDEKTDKLPVYTGFKLKE